MVHTGATLEQIKGVLIMKRHLSKKVSFLVAACGLAVSTAAFGQTTYSASSVPVAIPDSPTVVNTITVGGGTNSITSLTLTLNLTHTWDSDLDIVLVAPSGDYINLSTDNGGSGDNYTATIFSNAGAGVIGSTGFNTAPFTGTFRPEGLLNGWAGVPLVPGAGTNRADFASFNGQNANGTWTLLIDDDTGGDTGNLLGWSITVGGTIDGPSNPFGTASASPTSANNCGTATSLLTLAVTPGANPASTGLAVVGNLTNIGGSSTQAFVDNGTGGDAVAGDNIFSHTATVAAATPAGPRSISYTISDAEGRTGTTSGSLTVTSCPAVNDECANAIVIPSESTSFAFSTAGASNSAGFTYCAGTGADVFYSWTAPASGATTIDTCGANGDTVLAVFGSCAGGASIACNDDADVDTACDGTLQSSVTFGAVAGTTYVIAVRNWSSANPVITGNINIQAGAGILADAAFDSATANNCGDDTVLLTAVVTPAPTSTGITATADLTSLGGPSSQALFDNGTNGDVTAGDNTFSFLYTVPNTVTTGAKAVNVAVSDLEGRTVADTANITVGTCPPAAPACPAGTVAITATNINSGGSLTGGNFANGSASATVSGAGFNADTIRISGLVQRQNLATWASELRLRVTSPTGATYDFQPSPVAGTFGTAAERGFDEPAVGAGFRSFASLELPITAEAADGVWTVLAYEGPEVPASTVFDDAGLDATWLNLCVTISGAPTLPTCGSIDFNGDGLFPDDNDLVEFLTVLAGGECSPGNTCGSIDYNGDGLFPDDNDLVDFLTVLAGGTPSSCTP